MKKNIVWVVMVLSLTGCSEKKEFEAAILEQMKAEKDIKEYNISPEKMTACVVETSAENMPGLFPLDPERITAYKNYTKLIKLNAATDPKKTLEELRVEFGSPKKLAEAHANYTESIVNCMSGIVTDSEKSLTQKE